MELIEAIKKRVSVREYADTPIPGFILDEMLQAARLSPSGGNSQSYRFGVIKNATVKTQLAEAAGGQMWVATAPVVFACCADIREDLADLPGDDFGLVVNHLRFGVDFIEYMNRYPDRKSVKKLFANATPLIPAEHIYLTAVSHGLSACFIGYLDTERAADILNLPDSMTCLFLLPVGYPKGDTTPKEKKSIKEISFINRWGE